MNEKIIRNRTGRVKIVFFGGILLGILLQLTYCQAFSKMTIFSPRKSEAVLNNPYMGWAPRATMHIRKKDIGLPHRLVYVNITWAEFEPEMGQYQFENLEKINQFDYWTNERTKIIFRIVLDNPGENPQLEIPEWLYNKIDGDGTWYENSYGKGFSPNYANPLLISYHRKLIRAIAERYNNDPRIAFIELGSIGHWGEWHTDTNDPRNTFPKAEVADEYVKPYLEYFKDKYLMARRPTVIAKENYFGLYNDMFGNETHTIKSFAHWVSEGYTFWLTGEIMPAMPDFWKYAPSGGEFAPSQSFDFLSDTQIERTMEQAKLTHLSWLGPNCPADGSKVTEEVRRNADRFLNRMGYRLVLEKETHPRKVQVNTDLPVTLKWVNEGVAPFYYDWKIELSLIDQAGNLIATMLTPVSIRKIMPGMLEQNLSVKIPNDIAPGNYLLGIAIIDPGTKEPGIELAIEGKRDDGRYTLGEISVAF